jgi:hypothetical protein
MLVEDCDVLRSSSSMLTVPVPGPEYTRPQRRSREGRVAAGGVLSQFIAVHHDTSSVRQEDPRDDLRRAS